MGNLIQELNRHRVYKGAAIYVVASWLRLQMADTLFPAFEILDSATRVLTTTLFLGLPLILVFAWVLEPTPQGIKKTLAADPDATVVIRKRDYAFL